MKCFRCKKSISNEDDYFIFSEYHQKEVVNKDYCHKRCWDEFKGEMQVNNKNLLILERLNKQLDIFGVPKNEEVFTVC